MFRLCDADMYWFMSVGSRSDIIDRGIALHKMIRLITASTVGEGYLNFMGNEFGHPEWIDFPREGNGWSYHYCRRQWSLADDGTLKYQYLDRFDKAMLKLLKSGRLMTKAPKNQWIGQDDKVLIYTEGDHVFAFNFHPERSFTGYFVPVEEEGIYKVTLTTDDIAFGGFNRVDTEYEYVAEKQLDGRIGFMCYLPNRCATVLKKIKKNA